MNKLGEVFYFYHISQFFASCIVAGTRVRPFRSSSLCESGHTISSEQSRLIRLVGFFSNVLVDFLLLSGKYKKEKKKKEKKKSSVW